MTELIPNLHIGNWHEARDVDSREFYVITVAEDSPFVGHEHFNLADGPGNLESIFHDAVAATVEAHKSGKKVLVHCIGGRSRSAAVVVAAAVLLTERPLCEVYDDLLKKHDFTGGGARIHPYLAMLLLEYAK